MSSEGMVEMEVAVLGCCWLRSGVGVVVAFMSGFCRSTNSNSCGEENKIVSIDDYERCEAVM